VVEIGSETISHVAATARLARVAKRAVVPDVVILVIVVEANTQRAVAAASAVPQVIGHIEADAGIVSTNLALGAVVDQRGATPAHKSATDGSACGHAPRHRLRNTGTMKCVSAETNPCRTRRR
jgi:hypothetical protein